MTPLKATTGALGLLAMLFATAVLAAPPAPEFVQFKPSATKAALYRPDPNAFPDAHVAVVAMNIGANYTSHISMTELSERGFYVLGLNSRCDNNEVTCAAWEDLALDVKHTTSPERDLGVGA